MSDTDESQNTNIKDELIEEIRANRQEKKELLARVKKIGVHIDKVMTTSNDYRNKFALENKMKAIADISTTELAISKALDDSVKTEFELRRKSAMDDEAVEGAVDYRAVGEYMEQCAKKMNIVDLPQGKREGKVEDNG